MTPTQRSDRSDEVGPESGWFTPPPWRMPTVLHRRGLNALLAPQRTKSGRLRKNLVRPPAVRLYRAPTAFSKRDRNQALTLFVNSPHRWFRASNNKRPKGQPSQDDRGESGTSLFQGLNRAVVYTIHVVSIPLYTLYKSGSVGLLSKRKPHDLPLSRPCGYFGLTWGSILARQPVLSSAQFRAVGSVSTRSIVARARRPRSAGPHSTSRADRSTQRPRLHGT